MLKYKLKYMLKYKWKGKWKSKLICKGKLKAEWIFFLI